MKTSRKILIVLLGSVLYTIIMYFVYLKDDSNPKDGLLYALPLGVIQFITLLFIIKPKENRNTF